VLHIKKKKWVEGLCSNLLVELFGDVKALKAKKNKLADRKREIMQFAEKKAVALMG